MLQFFREKISQLQLLGKYRFLTETYFKGKFTIFAKKKYISFFSNDYLGLSQNKKAKKSAIKAIKKYGFGATGSRYISGNNPLNTGLEKSIAKIKNSEDAIIFGSGYLAAIGVIPALVGKKDLVLADKLIHASLLDGIAISKAKMARFAHNDVNSARKILEQHRNKFNKLLIITETVFSMDGDLGKIDELLALVREFGGILLSDDAHGLGIINNSCRDKLHLKMGTFSKSAGGYGGYACAQIDTINYLRNFSKSAIYTTALPPAILAGNLASLKIILKDKKLGKKALENAKYFCKLMKLNTPESTIVVIIVNDNKIAINVAKAIQEKGFLISAIRQPTVATARLRITFNSGHKNGDIKKLAKFMLHLLRQQSIIT
jgi:8-amino-7-oxononanoate synthase